MKFRCTALSLVMVAILLGCQKHGSHKPTIDLLVKNGTVLSGHPITRSKQDIAIHNSRIVAMGEHLDAHYEAVKTLDVEGLYVSAGFIDPHTHALSDIDTRTQPAHLSHYLYQGVTTLVVGNDGHGPTNVAAALERIEHVGTGTNVGYLVGHNTLRKEVIGLDDRPPELLEIEAMKTLVRNAMTDGALGLSTGLYYTPGSYAKTDEIVELARIVAEFDGIYDTHLRDESSYSIGLLGAIDETISIGRQSSVRLHIAHIKALGADVWGQSVDVVAKVRKAQAEGLVITADQYPWPASGTRLTNALLPGWVKDGGPLAMRSRLEDSALHVRIFNEMSENLRRRGGGGSILIVSGNYANKTLEQVAHQLEMNEINTAIQLILSGDARIASFNMRDDDIERFMQQEWVVTSSDGTDGHPRKFASFPRKYHHYVVEKQVLSLEDFIHRSTALTADILHLCNRGRLTPGAFADVVIFDPDGFSPLADFESPNKLSKGVIHLIVNGVLVIHDGNQTLATPGQGLVKNNCT